MEFGAPPPMIARDLFPVLLVLGISLLALASYGAHFRAGRTAAWAG
jgi:hypothetical protein